MNGVIVPDTIVEVTFVPATQKWDAECGECLYQTWFNARPDAVAWAHEHGLCNCDGSV